MTYYKKIREMIQGTKSVKQKQNKTKNKKTQKIKGVKNLVNARRKKPVKKFPSEKVLRKRLFEISQSVNNKYKLSNVDELNRIHINMQNIRLFH